MIHITYFCIPIVINCIIYIDLYKYFTRFLENFPVHLQHIIIYLQIYLI
jgi:hypothetical protein